MSIPKRIITHVWIKKCVKNKYLFFHFEEFENYDNRWNSEISLALDLHIHTENSIFFCYHNFFSISTALRISLNSYLNFNIYVNEKNFYLHLNYGDILSSMLTIYVPVSVSLPDTYSGKKIYIKNEIICSYITQHIRHKSLLSTSILALCKMFLRLHTYIFMAWFWRFISSHSYFIGLVGDSNLILCFIVVFSFFG